MNKTIVTIATGKQLYTKLAVNLARSFFWWHVDSDIRFKLITDQPNCLPVDLKDKVKLHIIQPGEFGKGFSSKLYLDRFAEDGQTIFIDSDCLIFGKLELLFERFKNHDVSVIGSYIKEGEWFGDVKNVCLKFNVPHLPKFNGGTYYLEKGTKAASIYQTARELEKKYDEIGFIRLRNQPNDEVLMALAMQLHGQTPIIDDSTIMSDLQACPGGYKIDAVNGYRCLINPPLPNPLHQNWYPFHKISPLIVHFLGYYTQHYPYKRETYRLKKAFDNQLNFSSEVIALLTIQYPAQIRDWVKKTFRPLYRMAFGTRKVKQSERLL